MKKVMSLMGVCALLFACQHSGKTSTEAEAVNDSVQVAAVDTLTYEGTLPAADGPGIRYELHIAQDSTHTFRLKQTYLEAENGQDKTFEQTGHAEMVAQTIHGKTLNGLKLVCGQAGMLYFVQVNDSTLRMVNEEWEEPVSTDLNYDLKLK